MKIRTVIVDDEAPALRRIKQFLSKNTDFELIGEADSGSEAIELITNLKPDLLILDIQLKDMTGFDVLKNIKALRTKIVFITAYDEFAIRAFEKGAIDYLLKPYKKERFEAALERIRKQYKKNEIPLVQELYDMLSGSNSRSSYIEVIEGKTTFLIDSKSLVYIKADGYHSIFYDESDGKKMIRTSLKNMEMILPENFVRVGRSYILNLEKMKSYKRLKNSIEVELKGKEIFSFNSENAELLFNVIKKRSSTTS